MLPSTGWLPEELNQDAEIQHYDLPLNLIAGYGEVVDGVTAATEDQPTIEERRIGQVTTSGTSWSNENGEVGFEILLNVDGAYYVILVDSLNIPSGEVAVEESYSDEPCEDTIFTQETDPTSLTYEDESCASTVFVEE